MASPVSTYLRCTRSNTYGFLASLPLFVAYEIFLLWAAPSAGPVVRVGAEIWTKELLWLIGLRGQIALGIVVILAGSVILWRDRKKNIPIRLRYFGGLLLECTVYAAVFAVVISTIVGVLFLVYPIPPDDHLTRIGLSIGAGLYEELFFRVLLVSGLFAAVRVLTDITRSRAYAAAAVAAALIFSAVHYVGPLGDVFSVPTFMFRFLFGLVLNALYVLRGFGAAAWTHALYDLMLVL